MADQEYQLVLRSQREPEAFRDLYRSYFPRIYAYVAYRVQRAEDAEDLVADIFMQVVKGLDRFEYRGEGSFTAWLFRIAHNRVSQFYRDASVSLSLDNLPDIQAHQLAPDQVIQRKERFAYLSQLIATLPPRRREIITLKFYGGLRNQEIAEVLELDERTVASHLSRGLDDLRRKVQPEDER